MTQPMASRNSLSISVPITQTAVSFVSFVVAVASPLHAVSVTAPQQGSAAPAHFGPF